MDFLKGISHHKNICVKNGLAASASDACNLPGSYPKTRIINGKTCYVPDSCN